MSTGYILGVDLGTTFTAAATYDLSDGQTRMLGLGNRALQIPSVLYLQPNGEFLVGESAARRGLIDPLNVVREFKRRIGDHVPIILGGSPYSAQSLTAHLLRWVVAQATERMGAAPESVTLTHPANWTTFKLDLLRQAAQLADLPAVRLCSEPEAAAQEYAHKSALAPGDRICVYDLGGGTFDAAVLARTADGFVTLGAPQGIEQLGGIDFDRAVFERVLTEAGLAVTDPDPVTTTALHRIRSDCADAKEALSTDVETTITVNVPGTTTAAVRLIRSDLEDMIRPAIADTITATNRALRSAATAPGDLSAVVLVGGSSRIPLVAETLTATYERLVARNTHPKHDIALGAARSGQHHLQRARSGPPALVGPPVAHPGTSAGQIGPLPPPPPEFEPGSGDVSGGPPRWQRRGVIFAAVVVLVVTIVSTLLVISSLDKNTAADVGSGGQSGPATIPTSGDSPDPGTSAGSSSAPETSDAEPTSAAATTSGSDTGPAVFGPSGDVDLPRSTAVSELFLVFPRLVQERPQLELVNRAGGAAGKQLTTDGGGGPIFSPDRESIVYLRDDTLRVIAVDGSGDRQLFDDPDGCARILRPAWNPVDPDVIGMVCIDSDGKYSLRRIRVDGSDDRTIPVPVNGVQQFDDLSYAPDGRTLTFWASTAKDSGAGAIYTMVDDGTDLVKLTDGDVGNTDADPMFSPDGTQIAFRRLIVENGVGQGLDIFVMPSDKKTEPTLLVGGPDVAQDPTWSPFGTFIVFKSNRDFRGRANEQHLWIIDVRGGKAQPLTPTDDAQASGAPAWARR